MSIQPVNLFLTFLLTLDKLWQLNYHLLRIYERSNGLS